MPRRAALATAASAGPQRFSRWRRSPCIGRLDPGSETMRRRPALAPVRLSRLAIELESCLGRAAAAGKTRIGEDMPLPSSAALALCCPEPGKCRRLNSRRPCRLEDRRVEDRRNEPGLVQRRGSGGRCAACVAARSSRRSASSGQTGPRFAVDAGAACPRAGFVENLARAIVATAAGGGDARFVLQHLETMRAGRHFTPDVAVSDAVAEADDHGARQGFGSACCAVYME
jgi:hypothetical protein